VINISVAACGGKEGHIPWTTILQNERWYIDPKYLPASHNFCLADPHNMKAHNLAQLLSHWQKRQDMLGKKETFRWSCILEGESTVDPQYGARIIDIHKYQAQKWERIMRERRNRVRNEKRDAHKKAK